MTTILRSKRSGNAAIELALTLPLLLLVLMGTADFGRVMSQATAVQHAARAGAQFGAISTANQTNYSGMITAALADIPYMTGATATARRYCTCGWGGENDCSTTCTAKRMYVETTVQATFTTIVPYPGIPSTTRISGVCSLRVQ